MISTFQPIKDLVKTRSVKTDNFVFRLHYQATTLIFLAASLILVSNQFAGRPIDCFTDGSYSMEEAFKNTIDNFCWITSVFTVKEHLCGHIGREVVYPGVGTLTPSHTLFDVHVTYRFLFFVVFLQAMSFFMPHLIWKGWESEKMKMLSGDLKNPMLDETKKKETIRTLTYYLQQGQMNGSTKYAFRLHLCEIMNLVNLGVNIWVTDYLFRNEFIGYGFKMLSSYQGAFYDPACDDPIKALFPQVAKCDMKSFGPSGNIQNRDVVCALLLNDFNAQFFKFIWFWFAFLLIVTVLCLLFRVVTIYSSRVRSFLLSNKAGRLPVTPIHNHEGGNCCAKICRGISYADWVLVMQLGGNMDPLTFKIFLESFCHQIEMKAASKQYQDKFYASHV